MAKQPPKKSRRKPPSKPQREHLASPDQRTPRFRDCFSRMVVPPELHDPEKRQQWNLEQGEHKRGLTSSR